MTGTPTSSSSWVYPDWDSWRQLLNLRPKPLPVMEKPPWWTAHWPMGRQFGPANSVQGQQLRAQAVRGEFGWAQRCLLYAQSLLPDSMAKDNAGKIAEALERVRLALDTTDKALAAEGAAADLAGIGAYDPARYPHAFVERASQCLTAAGRSLEACGVETVAYWGRTLTRMGRFFGSMKQELPPGQP
jgi:hypothetical protein